ncbi:uncharacterized protein PITG_06558 [Phytophthora infestans T30-4]|uniref:EH domain-containing protein n=2 Tax=Phytophthora infestans TaxID=4787 RepID=D0N546_PHYIT|nr:uncharacterized protein PITG_06558 [Phytophthora infestans T30-4]EEY70004.1 conserved hypothetical protein [Phytophthora infestans T30-4]KAF4039308.1 Cytoskeletal-regulatory complex EF hand [Phytophthora infestans]KAF4148948.1 Cytoskeletal-regulatory complex EF hand [Phytophthora infestans]KAI9983412.1 hypothetical protein PInf_007436 [Phytophthora infestans]|eukprot:XP_002998651.1 conserved hypothetical protein [Phytophthora infestans T30-4]
MSFASFPAPPSDDVQLDTQLYTMIELEGNRYRAFFAKLCGGDNSLISRDAALEFFRKSSLSEEQVQELYTRLKELHLLRDNAHMNETEFVMGMHFIVCMTKRNLVKIPPKFPGYLFPSLDLTPERQQSFDFPSPEEHSYTSEASSGTPLVPPPSTRLMGAMGPTISQIATSPMTSGAPLVDTKSLSELAHLEIRTKQHEAEVLSRVDQSEARALQSLHACVERIADQVDGLGFPVPSSARSLDALDDLRSLLQKHVHAAKQEIQSMQIDAQMRSVASEVAQGESREDPLKVTSILTQELIALQHQTAHLMAKKADVVGRLVAVKSGGSASESIIRSSGSGFAESKNPAFALSKGALTVGELGTVSASTTPPKNVNPSLMQSHNSASSGAWGTFGAAT